MAKQTHFPTYKHLTILNNPKHCSKFLCVLLKNYFNCFNHNATPTLKRKIMLNSVKFIPITMSFNIDSSAEYIETEIIMIKNAR